MLFGTEQHAAILAGAVTMTIRRWSRPQARVGGRHRLDPETEIIADAVDRLPARNVSDPEALACGFADAASLLAFLGSAPDDEVTRVLFHAAHEPDPRRTRGEQRLNPTALDELRGRLIRMDASRTSPWTRAVLQAIATSPGTPARRLAPRFGLEALPFKADVRKLKTLGLTRSLEVGYELSPLGREYLAATRVASGPRTAR